MSVMDPPLTNGVLKQCEAPLPLAIIGMACRTPGQVLNPEDLWQLCAHGRSGWSEIPPSRFNLKSFYHPNPDKVGSLHTIGGHFLQDDISHFDNGFFRISDKEAIAMDPQQRIQLECTYEAIESAGLSLRPLAGKNIGVFASGSFSDYGVQLSRDPETTPMYKVTGSADSFMSNRISYIFDFRGPSMTVETACSSSLTAMHLACQSIRAGECSMAVVSGCHLNLGPDDFISYSTSGILSAEGKSRAFDHRATGGFGRGEGAGCVILKPLDEAIQDGDKIRAVVRNSGVNQDGKTAGITHPSSDAQEALARAVYRSAHLDPSETDYIECHGTGTAVGDPIEATAIARVFGRFSDPKRPLYLASVKSNIGHLEGASGIVSVIKATLMLEKGFFLPNCDFEKSNPAIPFKDWNLKVPTKLLVWRSKTRRISINNFGFGGSNAHFVLEQAPKASTVSLHDMTVSQHVDYEKEVTDMIESQSDLGKTRRIIVLSANSEASLSHQAKRLALYISNRPEYMYLNIFSCLALTLQKRTLFQWRIVISATSNADIMESLDQKSVIPVRSSREPRISFVFTGQGAQWHAMGRELSKTYLVYAESLLRADKILKRYGCEWSLLEELSKDRDSSVVGQAYVAQPSCTAVQLALVDLLRAWDIRPFSVVGHSSGEIAAAYATGAIAFDTAVLLAYYRGKAATRLRTLHPSVEGAMLAIGGDQADINSFLKAHPNQGIVKACINSPKSVTMSGDASEIDSLEAAAKERGFFAIKLQTGVAYHSSHMQMVADYYRDCVGEIMLTSPCEVEFHSSVSGGITSSSALVTEYWVRNLTSPVLFSDALTSLCTTASGSERHPDILMEIGPHSALKGPIRETLAQNLSAPTKPDYMPSLIRFEDSVTTLLQTTSQLIAKGASLNLQAINFPTRDINQPILLTDLGTYPWDHSKSHWYESRIARGHRLRNGTRNDILGIPAADFNDIEPHWRNIIKIEDLPWLEHHQVQGNIVFPMSGFVSMAIEAMRFRAETRSLTVNKYVLRDIYSGRALYISNDRAVETMFSLRPYNESATASSDKWQEFRVLSWTDDGGWIEHCRGLIATETDSLQSDKHHIEAKIKEQCTTAVKSPAVYDMYRRMGIEFGPLFTGMKDVSAGPGHATGMMTVPDTAAVMPYNFENPCVIHPVALDKCFQFIMPTVTGLNLNFKALWVPESIKRLSVSSQLNSSPGNDYQVFGCQKAIPISSKKLTGSLFVDDLSRESSHFTVEIDDFTLVKVSDEQYWQRDSNLAFRLDWKPEINFIDSAQMYKLYPLTAPTNEIANEPCLLEEASLIYFQKALSQVPKEKVSKTSPHLQKLYTWMQHVCRLGKESSVSLIDQDNSLAPTKDICLERASRDCGPRGEFTCLMGENLPGILLGDVDPLSLLLKDELLKDYYSTQDCMIRSYHYARQCVNLIAHQNPGLKVLEVGAGTGGATIPILETLGGENGKVPRFLRYDFTDISSGYFDGVKELVKPWSSCMRYRILDIEKDLTIQGFDLEEYDVVVAANVLHATTLLADTMKNVRRLLKPEGRLILIEETTSSLRRFPFATLPGWWLSQEKDRSNGPLISELQWDSLLRETGFSGLDLCLQDYPGRSIHTSSVMVSTAIAVEHHNEPGNVVLISNGSHCNLPSLALDSSFRNVVSRPPILKAMQEVATLDLERTTCIVLDDQDPPFLAFMDEEKLKQVKHMCQAQGVVWVASQVNDGSNGPYVGLVQGLARSLRSENAGSKFVVLHHDSNSASLANSLAQIYQRIFLSNTPPDEVDFEFKEQEGVLCVPRVYDSYDVEKSVVKYGRPPTPELQPFIQEGRPLTLRHEAAGVLSGFYFEDKALSTLPLDPTKVRIDIKAMGINFKDVVVALGQVEGYLGYDCSGIVSAVGDDVKHLSVGDRVCAAGRETFSTFIECNSLNAVKIPDEMTFAEAASIPAIFCTAYYSLITIAHLQQGESVLIHAAAGGVGQAAIMLAQVIGADIYATVGSDSKKEHLMNVYGLTQDRIFSSRSPYFSQQVRDATKQRGVDVILNSLGGELLRASWESLAKFGRFVEIGKKDINQNSRLDMATFSESVTIASVDLEHVRDDKPVLMQSMLQEIMGLFQSEKLRTVTPTTTYPIDAFDSALHGLQSGKVMGKLVMEPRSGQMVKVMPKLSHTPLIRSDATYLITGGVGGLGRSMAMWFVQQGAKSLLLLSRSGQAKPEAKALMEECKAYDVEISVLQCDVGKEDQVRGAIEMFSESKHPIRGVIHGAMVLHDKLFEQISIEEYNAIISPKVRGAWNLHNLLRGVDLDFFVLLSSAAGTVGSRGQAAYAATSTFLGAFARWRQSNSLPASTIHLGAVGEVGYIAERSERLAEISYTYGDSPLTEREFLAFLRTAIENQHSEPEIITSLAQPSAASGVAQPYWVSDAKFSQVRRAALVGQDQDTMVVDQAQRSLPQLLRGVASLEAAQQLVLGGLMTKLCSLLMIQEEDLDPTKAIVTYGLDSLIAVEFRNWIAKEIGARIQLMALLTRKSLIELAATTTARSSLVDHKLFAQTNGHA